jgi:sugar O-acyltransferase (sialic acid O-acetyltransferase NeuD family)
MNDILLFPYNGNAREALAVIDAINHIKSTWNVLGFVDDNPKLHGQEDLGVPILGGRETLDRYPDAKVLACPGRPENFRQRDTIIESLEVSPQRFCQLIHPSISVPRGTTIGFNTLLMANIVLSINVRIGNHCVILPNTVISHESRIGDYCLIGSNVSISGNVEVQHKCYIGTGTKIIQDVIIHETALIGLGSVVIRSIPPQSITVGNPGRQLEVEQPV